MILVVGGNDMIFWPLMYSLLLLVGYTTLIYVVQLNIRSA
jgi:hypothetical protein